MYRLGEMKDLERELQRRVQEDQELAKNAIREYREALLAASKSGSPSTALKSRVHTAVCRYQSSLKELARLRERSSNQAP